MRDNLQRQRAAGRRSAVERGPAGTGGRPRQQAPREPPPAAAVRA